MCVFCYCRLFFPFTCRPDFYGAASSLSQGHAAYHFVGGQFLRHSGLEYGALIHKVMCGRYGERFLYVVVGYKDTYVAVLKMRHNSLYVLHRYWIHTGERLVQKYELGICSYAAGYLSTSAFAAGE